MLLVPTTFFMRSDQLPVIYSSSEEGAHHHSKEDDHHAAARLAAWSSLVRSTAIAPLKFRHD